jgi:hypothetical protein
MKGLRNKSVCINKRAHLTATAIAIAFYRAVGRSENPGDQVLLWGHNLSL